MKGIIIYETPLWGNEENTVYLQEVKDASYTLKQIGSDDITCYLEGIATKEPVTKATCNKEDTYDFEVGALIALMKKCGAKKAAEACCEAFPHETSGSIYRENKRYIKRIKELEKENERLKEKVDDFYAYNKGLIDEIDQKNHEIISLKALKLTNESLKKDNESFRKSLEKLKEENDKTKDLKEFYKKNYEDVKEHYGKLGDRNKYLIDDVNKKLGYLKEKDEEIKELKEENERLEASVCAKGILNNKLLKDYHSAQTAYEIMVEKSADLIEKVKKLEEENEKLKLDCEKLQHGYNDMIFCGGRQNGKQYTFLSNLFKGMPKDKVEAAYKEAYDKWIKLPSSRERMWDDILKEGRTPVYVKREDIHTFLEECQVTGIKWATGKMPFHMSKGYDGIYFFVMTTLDISKSTPGVKEFRHVMCWWMTASDEEARNSVKYIAPMRWDLFEKGRIYIRVKAEHFEEFKKACKAHLEKEPLSPFTYYSNGDVIVCYTDGHFRLTKTLNGFKKRSIVNWEDVR